MIIYYLNLFITYKTGFFQAEKYTDYPQSGEGLKINRRSNWEPTERIFLFFKTEGK